MEIDRSNHPKVAIYCGLIPSTTFIERLIVGLAEDGVEILLHGYLKNPVNYDSKNIKVIGYRKSLSKIRLILKYAILFAVARPRQLYQLRKCYLRRKSSKSFLKWFVKTSPIVWHKPDIFHLQWAKSIEDWIFLKEFGIKVVVSLRGAHINYSPIADKNLADMYLRIFPEVDAFHGVSEEICREASKYGADLEKCRVVYSGLNLAKFPFQTKKEIDLSNVKIISVGRPHWKKGYNVALDAMKILKDRGLAFKYKIIGGRDEELIYQIRDLGLKDCVSLEDNVSFEEVKILIANADVLLLPSVEEGIPNVILEAMALGTIVISTNCGGVSEVIEDGKSGFLVSLRNPLSIADKIQSLSRFSAVELNRLRQQARTVVEHQHNHQKMVEDMKKLYLSLE